MNLDQASAFLRAGSTSIGGGHPKRVLFAVSASASLHLLFALLGNGAEEGSSLALLASVPLWQLFIIVLPCFFVFLTFGHNGAHEAAVIQIKTIKLLIAESGISQTQSKFIWKALIDKYIEAIQPDISQQSSVVNLARDAIKGVDPELPSG